MSGSNAPAWGTIARYAVMTSLIAAVVLFFALPDDRWIAAVLVGVAVLDAIIFGWLLPQITGSRAAQKYRLEQLNREAEAKARSEEDWTARPDDATRGPGAP